MARINLDEIDFKSMSSKERLIWFLKNFNNVGYYVSAVNSVVVEEKELRKIFDLDYKKCVECTDLYQWFDPVFASIVNDRDFFRKHPDIRDHYKVGYFFDMEQSRLFLDDFTDDFVKLYLEHTYGIKDSNNITNNQINKIEIIKDETEKKKISFYINENYLKIFEFNRNKTWTMLYILARDQEVEYNKPFFDYFNSNKDNPIYKKHKFNKTKILKMNGEYIEPNIPIVLRSQKSISTKINKESLA